MNRVLNEYLQPASATTQEIEMTPRHGSPSEWYEVPHLRAYRSSPDRVTVQVRSLGSTARRGLGVKRLMISTATIDEAATRELIEFLQEKLVEMEARR